MSRNLSAWGNLMTYVTLAWTAATVFFIEGGLDRSQFARLTQSAYSAIRDVEFVYEGEVRWIGDASVSAPRLSLDKNYQGTFLYRHPSDRLIDTRIDHMSERRSDGRVAVSEYNGFMDFVGYFPDDNLVNTPASRLAATPISEISPYSPERFFYVATLSAIVLAGDSFGFDDLGWELVEEHKCMKICINLNPKAEDAATHRRLIFWLDPERGWHPLRVEDYQGENLIKRTSDIVLGKFEGADGSSAWLPLRSRTDQFQWGHEFHDRPVISESQNVVRDTIHLNRGIPNSRFNLQPLLASLGGPTPRKPRLKPEQIDAHLASLLEKAEEQTRMIEASSVARNGWGTWGILQAFVFASGSLAILTAWFLRRRA